MITDGTHTRGDGHISAKEWIASHGTLPRRTRRMPSLWRIAQHWASRDLFPVDLEIPSCFACEQVAYWDERDTLRERWQRASSFLDRAHLVDRFLWGLDGPQNIIPLCKACHRAMPSFDNGPDAIAWVRKGGGMAVLAEITVDALARWRKHTGRADAVPAVEEVLLAEEDGGDGFKWPSVITACLLKR